MKKKVIKDILTGAAVCFILIGMACSLPSDSPSSPDPAVLTVLNSPTDGTAYPADPGNFDVELSYSIHDDYYDAAKTYRIYGYFLASSSLFQVFSTSLTVQSSDSFSAAFTMAKADCDGIPVEVPYRLYFVLMNETDSLELAQSADLVYQDRTLNHK